MKKIRDKSYIILKPRPTKSIKKKKPPINPHQMSCHSQRLGIIISHQTRASAKLLRIASASHEALQRTVLLNRAAGRVDLVAAVAFASELESA